MVFRGLSHPTALKIYEESNLRVVVLGAGAWGTVLAQLAKANHHEVSIWSRHSDSLDKTTDKADVIISALSMKGVPDISQAIKACSPRSNVILVTATKGLNASTLETPSRIWHSALPQNPLVVLSGPNLAGEIAAGLPAATVVAGTNPEATATIQTLFNSEKFRVYTNTDPIGTELGGTLKNVMAIAAGVCDGLKLGTNAKSALLSRALPEMIQVGIALGAKPDTFWGLAGLGDLMATCNSPLSRNYRVGLGLAQGQTVDQIVANLGGTAEGVNTARVLVKLAKQEGIEVPISELVALLLDGHMPLGEVVTKLMARTPKAEAF